MSSNTNLINSTNNKLNTANTLSNKLNSSVNDIKSRFQARFPNDYTLDLVGGRIILAGAHYHFTGPNGKGAKQLAASNYYHWGGW